MKKIIHKAYWNPDKEQKWLNELAAKGLSLSDYSWMRYVFEETEPGKYIYQIELLEKRPGNPESDLYLRFLEDAGVEIVATYMRWVFLRKKASDGPFAIYSDCESKIRHLNRLKHFWTGLVVLELFAGFLNLGVSLFYLLDNYLMTESQFPWTNFIGGLLCTGIGVVFFFTLLRPVYLQIRKLRKEQALHD
ncbi:MAG: DUF2812 domain-containing protein [Eubacteriales bacterium]